LANLFPKLPISAIWGLVSQHFKSNSSEIWREGTNLRHPTALNSVEIAGGFVR